MPAAAVLPRVLEDKLDELAQQIRWLRLLRGLSWLALTLFATAVAAVLLDASLDLTGPTRGLLLSGWVAGGGLAAWRLVLRPLRRPIPVADLAAAVEGRYPSLAERLYSVVELSEHAGPGNGSQALIAVLTRDTAQRTRRLNFFRAAPTGSVVRLALLAVLAAASALAPVLVVTGAAERVRRFLLPWYTPRADVPYRVVVSSGDPVVKRGEAVTLTGYLERLRPDATIPETAAVVYREAGAAGEKRLPMAGDDKAAFHVTRPGVAADFEYCLEAGPARSDWHAVTVVDPVDLGDGTAFTVTPPGYAEPTFREQKTPGLREFEGLQFSKVRFDLRFTRPATSAAVEWKPSDPNGPFPPERFPVILAGTKTAGFADFTLKADGTLKFIFLGEHNVRTEVAVATKAVVDTPPRFVKVTGVTDQPQDIRPDDRLPIDLAVEDDVKVEKVVLEYTVNGKELPVFITPLPLRDLGTPRAEGKYQFDLAGKAKEGDSIQYRVRATDGRLLSESEFRLTPQEAIYPEKGWAELRLRASARPLAEQEILAQKEKVKEKLKAAARDAADALAEVEQVKKDAAGKQALGVENTVKLENARNKAKDAARALEDLAREAGLTPDLRQLADAVRDVAEAPLRQADEAMRKAGNEPAPQPRDKALKDAADRLDEAVARLHVLGEKNEAIARDRLDRKALEQLAAEQAKLAEQAKKTTDPEALKEIARKQQKLNDDLRDLVKGNETLRKAVDELAREDARDLADRAKELADAQRRLDAAARETAAGEKKKAFDEIAKDQDELKKKEADLAKKTQTPARLADTAPADPEQFDKAGEKLADDKPVEAMTEQEKAARELDRLAAALERAAAARKDTKEAARQLARLEDDLRKRAQEAAKDQPSGNLTEDQKKRLQEQQEAVRRAAEKLQTPPADEPAAKAKREAVDALAKARDALAGDGRQADDAMREAADALRKLGDKLPTRDQRLRQAKADLDKLRQEQEALSQQIDDKLKGTERQTPDAAAQKQLAEKMAEAAAKQAELAKKLDGLDTPGLDCRKDRAAGAARQAAEDLQTGRSQDIPASQQEARRQADRLRQALDGQTPADEAADALAGKQKELADAADKLTKRPDKARLQAMQDQQREIARRLDEINDPAVAARLTRARDAAKAAEDALRTPNDVADVKEKTRAAADELQKLSDDLAGTESDAARADRLARDQQARAEAAKKNAGKPTTPEASAAERREVEQTLDDLQRTRAGKAQEAKKKAADALQRVRQNPTPDRAPGMQKAAADALRDLADQMGKNGDRSAGQPRPGAAGDPADDDAGGQLPSKADARQARDQAKQQRDLKDRLAEANERAGRPTPPTDNAGIEKLAKDQDRVAKEAAAAAKEAGGEGAAAGEQAAREARAAADQLKAGAPGAAKAAGEKAGEQLDKMARAAGDTPAGKKAKELAGRQKGLNRKMAEAARDAGAAAAQQKARQDDLAKEAGQVADKLDEAARSPAADPNRVDREALKKAADAAREAGREMERANREQAAGRKAGADEAREKAGAAMERAAGEAAAATGQKPGDKRTDPNARDAGRSVQQADANQQAGQQQAEQGKGQGAGKAMQQAADQLGKAADSLAKGTGGKGEGSPGKGGGVNNPNPGGNDGSGKGAPTAGDLPADVAQYLGKPWGDLPGDVKTKIIQDLKAKYGEDYARVIKLYFEQIADRK